MEWEFVSRMFTKPLEFASARNKITWSQVVKRSADYNHWQQ